MYVATRLLKLSGSDWRDGTAVYWVVHYELWARPLAVWLRTLPVAVLGIAGYVVVAVECIAPLLLFAPFRTTDWRTVAMILLTGLQILIGASLEVWLFPWVSTIALLPFLPTRFWQRTLGSPVRRAGDWSWHRRDALAALAFLLVILGNVELLSRDSFIPAPVARVSRVVGLTQEWHMYAPSTYADNVRLIVSGRRQDGSVALLDGGDHNPGHGVLQRLRSDYRAKMYLETSAETNAAEVSFLSAEVSHLARWVCRRWNEDRAHEPVVDVTLRSETTTIALNRAPQPPRITTLV